MWMSIILNEMDPVLDEQMPKTGDEKGCGTGSTQVPGDK